MIQSSPLLLLVAVAGLVAVHAAPNMFTNTNVLSLSEATFDELVTESETQMFLVNFYEKSDKAAMVLRSPWISLAKKLKRVVNVAAVEMSANTGLVEKLGVSGPGIRFIRGADISVDYTGKSNAKDINAFALEQIPDEAALGIKKLTKKSRKKIFKKMDAKMPKVLVFVKKGKLEPEYRSLAVQLEGRAKFFKVEKSAKKLVREYDVPDFPAVVVLPGKVPNEWDDEEDEDDDEPMGINYQGKMTANAIGAWVRQYALVDASEKPDLEEVSDQSCLEALCTMTGSLCAILIADVDPTEGADTRQLHYQLAQFNQMAESRTDKVYRFMWLDGGKHADFIQSAFNLSPAPYPQIVVYSAKKKVYAEFVGSFNADSVGTFLSGVAKGGVRSNPVHTDDNSKLALTKDTERCKGMQVETLSSENPDEVVFSAGPIIERERPPRVQAGSIHLDAAGFDARVKASAGHWMVAFVGGDDASAAASGADEEEEEDDDDPVLDMDEEEEEEKEENAVTETEFVTAWQKSAEALRNQVRFATVDVAKNPELAKSYGVDEKKLPYIVHVPAGEGSFKEGPAAKKYSGKVKGITDHAKGLLSYGSSDLVADLAAMGQDGLSKFLGESPEQPHVILFTEKEKIPGMMAALAVEYVGEIDFGIVMGGNMQIAQQFGITKLPSMLKVKGVKRPHPSGKQGMWELQLDTKVLAGSKLKFNKLVKYFDKVANNWFKEQKVREKMQANKAQSQSEPDHDEL